MTVVSDPLPTILDGIPLQLQHINVTVNRPGFTFNPTSCEPMSVTGAVMSSEGKTATVSSPFQVANCASLPFKPGFTAATEGKTSKADGASLKVKLTFPSANGSNASSATGSSSGSNASGATGPTGEANIKSVKVELPKALPSRLTTLQKACIASTFESNPANCPPQSIVGHAKAITPILSTPLEGPAYFVSHGNESFPQLILVLQGLGDNH